MSSLSQFAGFAATKGVTIPADTWSVLSGSGGGNNTGTALSFGATTANVYKTLLNITGRGFLDFVGYVSNASTSRTVKIRLTIDGTVVFTSTSGTLTTGTQYGRTIVGMQTVGTGNPVPIPLRFNASCLIEVQDNVGGTIDQWINYVARTE